VITLVVRAGRVRGEPDPGRAWSGPGGGVRPTPG